MITLIFGCLLGWGLGAAAMKAALAVRDQVQTAQELQTVKSSSVAPLSLFGRILILGPVSQD